MSRGSFCLLISLAALAGIGGLSVSSAPNDRTGSVEQTPEILRVSPQVFSGPTPSGQAAMDRLVRLGIRTIVSVDGARPDVEAAAAVGMEYVHVPIGYDTVPDSAVAMLTRVMHQRSLPVYVHCHHGKHRGPAAAAICARIAGELSRPEAVAFLEMAGTSRDYLGLWDSVTTFAPLPPDTPLPPLVPVAEVEPLVEVMLHIDQRFDRLATLIEQQRREDGAAVSRDHAPSESVQTALLLHEDFRESVRLLMTDQAPDLIRRMQSAERQTSEIVARLRDRPAAAAAMMVGLQETCQSCHRQHRD